jgi:hypothetical protein
MHAYEGHAYGMASVRNTPMRDTPIYIGWRKGVAFVAGGGVEYGSAGLSRFHPPLYLCWEETLPQELPEAWPGASPSHFPGNQPTV